MVVVQEENPEIGEPWFVKYFVNGLREGIKFQIRPLRPQTLTDAYCLAKDVEPYHPPVSTVPKKQGTPYANYYQKNTYGFQTSKPATVPYPQQLPIRQPNTNTTATHRIRKEEECWRCGDKWVHGHKCKLIPNVHLVQQETEEPQQNDTEEGVQQEQGETTEQEEHAMFLSAYAMGHQLAVPTPTMVIHINVKRAIALLDSGSTSSFLNQDFAVKANCHFTSCPSQTHFSSWRWKVTVYCSSPKL